MHELAPATLTVVVLTYNHGDTISRALESILEQETTHPYQIWICEDCSTDNTLEICQAYAAMHPDKIKLIAQSVNTKGSHFQRALTQIRTPYFAILEGDDYWCDTEKIQVGVDLLERCPEYATFAHDTLYYDALNGTRRSLVHEIHKAEVHNPVGLQASPYFHMSARIHRNVVDFDEFKVDMLYDIYLFYLFLDRGMLYYHDKIMSVYNITGAGMWSKLTEDQQVRRSEAAMYVINRLLDYRQDSFFSTRVRHPRRLAVLKRIFGSRFGWRIYFLMMQNVDP